MQKCVSRFYLFNSARFCSNFGQLKGLTACWAKKQIFQKDPQGNAAILIEYSQQWGTLVVQQASMFHQQTQPITMD
jgi:hypothetical protein